MKEQKFWISMILFVFMLLVQFTLYLVSYGKYQVDDYSPWDIAMSISFIILLISFYWFIKELIAQIGFSNYFESRKHELDDPEDIY